MTTVTAAAPMPCLRTAQGHAVPLQALAIEGRVEHTLARISLTQTFHNLEAVNVEAVYTFPLPVEAVLLELKVSMGERSLVGRVSARRQAEAQYEEALSEGHSAVMLEQVEPGLYTLNLGNLLAGDRAQIHLHYALPLRWEADELRLSLPTTLAPRYGDAARAGVQPHQQPQADALAEYPYRLSLEIGGALSLATLTSPTHRILTERDGDRLRLRIADEHSFADRDFVLSIQAPGSAQSSLALAADGEAQVAHAVFRVPARESSQPIHLKMLIDCSGSMAGDSMALAKALAMRALDSLGSRDRFSLTAFGSQHRHHANGRACDAGSGAALVQGRGFVGGLDADLGGTEMLSALQAVFGAEPGRQEGQMADVLLITDGETWDRDAIVAAARASGHRIFVIGVGSSPSEILARGIAESTGGFASFAAPCEDVAPVIARHLARMRLPRVIEARLHLPGTLRWQCPAQLEPATFAGDTLHVFAGLDAARPGADAHLDIRYADGSTVTICAGATPSQEAVQDGALSRLGAAQRLWWAGAGLIDSSEQELTELAVRYQLMSRFTNTILVHERDADAAQDLPELRTVPGMLAAGWGGRGSVAAHSLSCAAPVTWSACMDLPPAAEKSRSAAAPKRKLKASAAKALHTPGTWDVDPSPSQDPATGSVTPGELIDRLNPQYGLLRPARHVPRWLAELESLGVPAEVIDGLRGCMSQGHDEETVVLAFWKALLDRKPGLPFERAHRRGILAALKARTPDAELLRRVANSLRDTVADVWRWQAADVACAAPV